MAPNYPPLDLKNNSLELRWSVKLGLYKNQIRPLGVRVSQRPRVSNSKMGSLGHLRIILTPSGMVPSGHPQIVLNYGRNAGMSDAPGHWLS
jgi:hypothetical protein